VSAVLTLLVAAATYKIAEKSYTQIEREDPWKLTYQKNNYWLLERIHPIRATLWGYEIYNPVKKDEDIVGEITYCNIHNADQIFVRGSKVLVKMPELPVGAYFTLYFANHSRRKKFHPLYAGHYKGAVKSSMFDLIPANTWVTPLC
jgi:hypothetical protein